MVTPASRLWRMVITYRVRAQNAGNSLLFALHLLLLLDTLLTLAEPELGYKCGLHDGWVCLAICGLATLAMRL